MRLTASICRCCKWQFFFLVYYVKQLDSCILPLASLSWPRQRRTSPSITAGSKRDSTETLREEAEREKCPACRIPRHHWPRLFVLCSPLRYILVQFYQHFSPSFQSCWKQHFEWEDEVCPFSCVLSLSTLAPLRQPTYTPHLIQIENLSEENRENAQLEHFPRVSSVINHRVLSLHQDSYNLYMPPYPFWYSDNTLLFCAE